MIMAEKKRAERFVYWKIIVNLQTQNNKSLKTKKL